MKIKIALCLLALPFAISALTSAHASDSKEKYVFINKTKHAAYAVCGNWIDSSINMSPGQTKTFTSHKFYVVHVMFLDKDEKFTMKDYLAQDVPGFQSGKRFAFDQGGTYEFKEDGMVRTS